MIGFNRPMHNGRRIVPSGIKAWLRNRGLHWPCFCSLVLGQTSSSQIVESMGGDVLVFCHDDMSKCRFYRMLQFIAHLILF